jgi:hypothetical protein
LLATLSINGVDSINPKAPNFTALPDCALTTTKLIRVVCTLASHRNCRWDVKDAPKDQTIISLLALQVFVINEVAG